MLLMVHNNIKLGYIYVRLGKRHNMKSFYKGLGNLRTFYPNLQIVLYRPENIFDTKTLFQQKKVQSKAFQIKLRLCNHETQSNWTIEGEMSSRLHFFDH